MSVTMNVPTLSVFESTDFGTRERKLMRCDSCTPFKWYVKNICFPTLRRFEPIRSSFFKIDPDGEAAWQIELLPPTSSSMYYIGKPWLVVTIKNESRHDKKELTIICYTDAITGRKKVTIEANESHCEVEFSSFDFRNLSIEAARIPYTLVIQLEVTRQDASLRNPPCGTRFLKRSKESRSDRLGEDMKSILKKAKFSDAALAAEGQVLHVHKAILSGRSDVFRNMFEHNMKKGEEKPVHILDTAYDTLQQLVSYLYSGTLDSLTIEKAKRLLVASDKYGVQELKETCAQFMEINLSVDNCIEIVLLADRHSILGLKNAGVQFFAKNCKVICGQPDWKAGLKTQPLLMGELIEVLAGKMGVIVEKFPASLQVQT